MRVLSLNTLNRFSGGEGESGRERVGFGGGGRDHAEASPVGAGQARFGMDQMVVVAVFGEGTAVAAAGGERPVDELGGVVKFLLVVGVFDADVPGATLGVGADGARLA